MANLLSPLVCTVEHPDDVLTPTDIANGINDETTEFTAAVEWLHAALQQAPGATAAETTIAAELLAGARRCAELVALLKAATLDSVQS